MPDIRIKQGDALLLQLTFQNEDGTPVDLTNATLTGQFRTPQDDLVTTIPFVRTTVTGVVTVTICRTVGTMLAPEFAALRVIPVTSATPGMS